MCSRYEVQFADCFAGNTYYESVQFINAGDVQYPLTLSLHPPVSTVTYDILFLHLVLAEKKTQVLTRTQDCARHCHHATVSSA
jgi:hypothetical protein